MEKFRKLEVWKRAHVLVLEIYKATEKFPREELYGLVSQMRRAAISVVANIAEGTKRQTAKDKAHFIVISDTSLEELKCYFLLSYDLQYLSKYEGRELMEKSREAGCMLHGYRKSVL